MKIFIVVLNFNRAEETIECLHSLKKLEIKNWKLEIVVVDNASEDNSVDLLRKKFSQVHLIVNKENLGFAQGNNLGIRYAFNKGADYIMLLNNDTLVDKKALIYLIKAAKKIKKAGILSPKIYFAPGYEYYKERYGRKELGKVIWYAGGRIDWENIFGVHEGLDEVDKGQFDKQRQVEFVSGCCMFIKRAVFEKIGLLDEHFFLYLEDMDFCVRAKKVGFKLLFIPHAVIWHKNLGTDEKSSMTRQAYYYTRNRLIFGLKYASFRTKMALVKESLKLLASGNYWQRRGVLDFYLRRFGKGSYCLHPRMRKTECKTHPV